MGTKDNNLERRLQNVEQELGRIKALYDRTISYQDNDPETSLIHARKAAEAICLQLFIRHINPHPKHLNLDGLLQRLTADHILPDKILIPLHTIQRYGNYAAHEQDNSSPITKEYIQPCLQALATVVEWYFAEHHHVSAPPAGPAPAAGDPGRPVSREHSCAPGENPLRVSTFAAHHGITNAALIRLAREILHIEIRTPSALLTDDQAKALEEKIISSHQGEYPVGAPQVKAFDLPNGSRLELVKIMPGCFCMGSPVTEEGHNDDEVQHQVVITRPFYLSRYPITQDQYEGIVGVNPSYFRGKELPVEMVSWFDAASFCELLTERFGKRFRLPTEAEWEYACRAGTVTPFSTGNELSTNQANYDEKLGLNTSKDGVSRRATTPVNAFPPNPWGIHDLHGNVWEWCSDWYGPYPNLHKTTDPQGPDRGDIRILRGGSWFHSIADSRSAQRDALDPGRRHSIYGFRVALTL